MAAVRPPTAKRKRAKVLGHGAKDGRRQEQQRAHQDDRASSTKPKVALSVRMVPTVKGVVFFAARLAASASGAMMGMYRLINITRPVAMSQYGLNGAGAVLSL